MIKKKYQVSEGLVHKRVDQVRDEKKSGIILNVTELVDNASVPAGGPFIVLLPAGGPFTFWPLVDNASVTAGGPFIFCSTLLDVTADVSLQV